MGQIKEQLIECEHWMVDNNYESPYVNSDEFNNIAAHMSDDMKLDFYEAEKQVEAIFKHWIYLDKMVEHYEGCEDCQ